MKVKILKYVEGRAFKVVILETTLLDALIEYNEANSVFMY